MTPGTLYFGPQEHAHLAKATLAHMYRNYTDTHPTMYLKALVPALPQILPLLPIISFIRPLPVVDFDEEHVMGNIDTIHAYGDSLG